MFCLYTSSKLSSTQFEFSLKVKVMGSNPGYLLKYFLLYAKIYLCILYTQYWYYTTEVMLRSYSLEATVGNAATPARSGLVLFGLVQSCSVARNLVSRLVFTEKVLWLASDLESYWSIPKYRLLSWLGLYRGMQGGKAFGNSWDYWLRPLAARYFGSFRFYVGFCTSTV